MALRLPADWMSAADDRILEYLESEGPASPTQITDDERIQFGRPHANNRLKKLTHSTLVRLIGNGIYEITDCGQMYLAGELDASELEDDDG